MPLIHNWGLNCDRTEHLIYKSWRKSHGSSFNIYLLLERNLIYSTESHQSCSVTNMMYHFHVGFEIATEEITECYICWDITPCDPVKANYRYKGTFRLRLLELKIIRARNKPEAGSKKRRQVSKEYSILQKNRSYQNLTQQLNINKVH
jgi:hypothetical protein